MLYLNNTNCHASLILPQPLLSHNYREIVKINDGKTKTSNWLASWALSNASNYKWLIDYGNSIRLHVDGRLDNIPYKHDLPDKPRSPFRFHPDFPGNLYILKSIWDIREWVEQHHTDEHLDIENEVWFNPPSSLDNLKKFYLALCRRGEFVMWDVDDSEEFAIVIANLIYLKECGLVGLKARDRKGNEIALVEIASVDQLEDEVQYALVWNGVL